MIPDCGHFLMTDELATLKRQLVQLKELRDTGVLDAVRYDETRAPLERKLVDLVLAGTPPAGPARQGKDPARPSKRLLAALCIGVVLFAALGYWWTRSPGEASVAGMAPESIGGLAGQPHSTSAEQIAAMAERLSARLKDRPDDVEGWSMLGRSLTVLNRHADAIAAYAKAVALRSDDAALLADYADALAVQNGGKLEGEPMKWIERALRIEPGNVKALSLAGTAAFDRKDYAAAVRHWESAVRLGSADGAPLQQIQAGIAEARELGKLPPTAIAVPAVQGASGAAPTVSGTVKLAPALASRAGPDDTVFIFARSTDSGRMPLAVLRKRVRDLPVQFTLDDSMAMSPAAKLSGASQVVVAARISKSGDATVAAGDLSGQSSPVALGASGVSLTISEVVKQ